MKTLWLQTGVTDTAASEKGKNPREKQVEDVEIIVKTEAKKKSL